MEIVDKRASSASDGEPADVKPAGPEHDRFLVACAAGEVSEWHISFAQSVALAREIVEAPPGGATFVHTNSEEVANGAIACRVTQLQRPDGEWVPVIVGLPGPATEDTVSADVAQAIDEGRVELTSLEIDVDGDGEVEVIAEGSVEPPTVTLTFLDEGEVRVDLTGGASLEEQVAAAYAIEHHFANQLIDLRLIDEERDDCAIVVTFVGPHRIASVRGSRGLTVPKLLLAATFLRSRTEYVLNQGIYSQLVNLITSNVVMSLRAGAAQAAAGGMPGVPGGRIVVPR